MGTRMKNKSRDRKEFLAKGRALILAALDKGFTTRKKIGDACGLKTWQVADILKHDENLWAQYTMHRKTLTDLAADNIQDILEDPNHKDHFQASKYILQKYKSDFDDSFESQQDEGLQIGSGEGKSVKITFTKD